MNDFTNLGRQQTNPAPNRDNHQDDNHPETEETLPHGEERVHWNQRYGEILTEIAEQFLESEQPQVIIAQLCRKFMEFLDCHVFFQYVVDEKKGRLRLNACAGVPEEIARELQWLDFGAAVCG
ncbi:MAG TPA: hypothetical protein VHY08_05885, partial [Bacillota bacterium]|nr:hypothetical protein [Bacillota bacterium]